MKMDYWGAFRSVGFLVAAVLLVGCANPFSDASTKGPTLTVSPGVGRLTVTWNPVLAASGYRLEWSMASDFTGATVVEPASSPLVVETPTPGATYYLRARANLKSGPTSWATASVPVSGWTWARPPMSLGSQPTTVTVTDTVTIGGVAIPVTTTYTKAFVRYETVRYDANGLKRSSFIRTTTSLEGVTGSTTTDTTPVVTTGSWDTAWSSFTLNSSPTLPGLLAPNRTSFTLDGATWKYTP